jgi:hypothetical protein
MRMPFLICAPMILFGCSSAPVQPPPHESVVANASQSTASARGLKIDGNSLANAQKLGFTPVNEHGEVLYCREEKKTGSHIRGETVCVTEAELQTLRERTQHGLNEIMRQQPPPALK